MVKHAQTNQTKSDDDIITDAVETLCQLAQKNGVTVDEKTAKEAEQIIRAKWWGDRPYIRIKADTDKRNTAIRAEYARGERVAYLARKYQITRQSIYLIIKDEG